MNQAALAHLGERQTEVQLQEHDIWRHCVRSTEAAYLRVRVYPDYRTHNIFLFLLRL
jgi:hypothetical protein